MARSDEYRPRRPGLEHPLRFEPTKLAGRVRCRKRRPVRPFARQSHIDFGRLQYARAKIARIRTHTSVITRAVAFFVVRRRDGVQRVQCR